MAKIAAGTLAKLNDTITVQTDLQRVYTGQSAAASGVGFDISGIFVGTVAFEGTIDDTNWFPVAAWPIQASGLVGSYVIQTLGTGPAFVVNRYITKCLGLSQVRVRMSAYTSGSAQIAAAITADDVVSLVLKELMITNELLNDGLNLGRDIDADYRKDTQFGVD